jgi:hypothetical protein
VKSVLSTLTKQLDRERKALNSMYSSVEMNAWCHMLVYVVNSLPLWTLQLYVLLLNREGGCKKRQVVIHIIHSTLQFPSKCLA